MSTPSNYYLARRKRFLLEFDLVAKSSHSVIGRHINENADILLSETRREFESLIPQLPYVGGKQPFTEFVVFTGMLLAVYRVGKARGKTVEQTGVMIHEEDCCTNRDATRDRARQVIFS